jgi:hypothetical protein
MQATDLIGKTALEISKLWPPNRNEESEYSDIWWASHHLCYKGERPDSVYSGEITKFRFGSYSELTLMEYKYDTGNTVWENKQSMRDNIELIEIYPNGSFWYSYIEKGAE